MMVEKDSSLQGYYSQSVLANKAGDLAFTAPKGTTLSAASERTLFNSGNSIVHKKSILEESATDSTINLRNVGYWNVGTVFGKSKINDVGQYTIDLAVNDKNLTGTVTNDFSFELKDVSIWSGNILIPIGDIAPGESIQINEQLKTTTLIPRNPTNNMMNQPQVNNDDLMAMRKNSLLAFSGENIQTAEKPALIGYANAQIIPVTLEEKKVKNSSLTMIIQPIEVDFTFKGKVVIEEDLLGLTIRVNEDGFGTHVISQPREEGYYEGNEYLQSWQLPEQLLEKEVNWISIKISNINQQLYTSKLLNVKTGKFEKVDTKDLVITEQLRDYISEDGKLVNRVEFLKEQYGEFPDLPKIELTGEVKE